MDAWTIPETIREDDAIALALEASGPATRALGAVQLFYPYYWSLVRPSRNGTSRAFTQVYCLVDGRTGVPASTDSFTPVWRTLPERVALVARLDAPSCRDVARKYVTYVLARTRRARAASSLEATMPTLLYKPFWVVDCGRDSDLYSLLVDGVTGAFHVFETATG